MTVSVALLMALPGRSLAQGANEAAIVSKQALDYYYKGRYGVATELYRRAYKLDPQRPEYLYGAARSEHKAGRLKAAIALYDELLAKAAAGSRYAVKARHHRDAAKAALQSAAPRAATPPRQGPAPPPAKVPDPQATVGLSPVQIGGWTAVAVGGLCALGAAAMYSGGAADNETLDQELSGHTAADPVTSMTWAQARDRRQEANDSIRLSWLLAGAGAVGLGAGAWLLLTRPERGDATWQLRPQGSGLAFTARF